MSGGSFRILPAHVRGVIFDCDGVILNSRAANALYYNKILSTLNLPPLTPEQEAYTFMATVKQALAYITPPHLHERLPDICREAVNYQRDIMPHVELEPGLREFLRWLHARDIRMAVHTNRSNGMPLVLKTFQLEEFFTPVVTAAMVQPKPHPQGVQYVLEQWQIPAGSIIFIGDSQNDARTAAAADVAFVAYGQEPLDAAVQVGTFRELEVILEQRL